MTSIRAKSLCGWSHTILQNTRPYISTRLESKALYMYVGILLTWLMKCINSPWGYPFEVWNCRSVLVWKNTLLVHISAVVEFVCKILSSGQGYGQDNVHDHTLVPPLTWLAPCGRRNFLRDTGLVYHIGWIPQYLFIYLF